MANSEQHLSDSPFLTETEKHQLLVEWNNTKRDYSKDKCIHELVEEQVERTPDAVALVFDDQQLNYRELNRRGNQLAHYLRKLGVGPEVLVGICLERSLEMVVGLLGILKAGGAYVPLDPTYPKKRLEFMLEDSGTPVLLTQQRLFDGVAAHSANVICLDRDWKDITRQSEENADSEAKPANLAYVIYTSGSTGNPKGVMNIHRGICNRLLWMQDTYRLTEADRVLQKTPFSFDVSVWEFFWPLIAGARLIVARPEGHRDAAYLVKLISEQQITTVHFVPSMLRIFLEEQGLERCNCLRHVICSGEALPLEVQERFFARLDAALYNLYGPTEASIDVTFWACTRESDQRIVPIGSPIANTQIYLLDSRLQPVPVGAPGELCIGGVGLARGYLHRPELTAEKFIPDPFTREAGARLYKTGDLARYLPDGNIDFLSRIDEQVKIRGFRIEPGEIEAALAQHPAVRASVVAAREDMHGQKRLAAYLVLNQAQTPAVNDLRSFLKAKLPEYMVPSAFVTLESLPLMPNGKLDRRALPAPNWAQPSLEEVFVAPRTPVEETLAEIWAEVLKLERVGIHDNFLELGGHSLLATQLISRVRDSFRLELALRSLFEAPTVAGSAKHIESVRQGATGARALPILPEPVNQDCPLSFSQERFWFLNQLEPNNLAYKVTFGFRLTGPLKVKALEQSLTEIVRRHETLRTTFHLRNGEPVQVISERWSFPLTIIDLRRQTSVDSEAEVQRLFENERRRLFDLSVDLLLRASLLQLGADEHVLILSSHHIAWDHWCIEIFFRELSVVYQAYAAGRPSPLPELPIQYKHYAVWQRKTSQDKALENHLAYWKRQLANCPAVLNLPHDHPRSPAQIFRGDRLTFVLPKALTNSLIALSREANVTLFMTLLAAFKILLHRLTGQDDIVIGSPIAERDRSETENLIGLFLNTLVLRTNLSGNPTFRELLARVREVAFGAYDHRYVPFEKLVEEMRPKRDLSHSPLFQVLFNMYNFEEAELDLDGLSVKRLAFTEPVSMFDLTLYVRERDNVTHISGVYNADLFSKAWMTCFLQQYRYLIEQVVSEPWKPIRSYSLATPETVSLLPDASAALPEPSQELVTGIFSSWAKQTPKHPAVSQGEQTWTYDELAERAETLARDLRASGLQQGDVVAVYGRRSFGLIASVIGTLLSGGVLLPVDYNLPGERKQLMLKEARARKILSIGDGGEDAWVNADYALDILSVDPATGCAIDLESRVDLKTISLPEVSPNDPAYIFFTSGTTGIPKAVLGCHKSLSHFLAWQRQTFAIGPGDRSAQLTALSFDAVLRDIFLPLTSGATLCLPEVNDVASGEILQWLERQQITVLHAVPSLAQSWLAYGVAQVDLRSMRWVFFVGEPLTEALVRQWRAAFPDSTEIVNLYGPTETTLVKCFYRVPADIGPGVQPVGWPIPDTQALVLAGNHQLCGINEPGEIVLRTPFRSLGYVNAPEENQKRFVTNPFRDDPQDLIYFTGDAGCYRPDGSLEILGRLDDQVKIRGVRVEPAEVTATLARHPLVESCVVVGNKNERDETYLAAYAVASEQEKATSTQLRSYLVEQLPAAMVPAFFVFLDSLPLTPNGKVDRRALPAPDQSRPELEENYQAPRTPVEEMVAEIWAEVLKIERVGINDNFFDLGGHSLLATQIISRLRDQLQMELSLRTLFEKPTIVTLATAIMEKQAAGVSAKQVADILAEVESLSEEEIERQPVTGMK